MDKESKLFFIIQKLLKKPHKASEIQKEFIKKFDYMPQPKDIYEYIKDLEKVGFDISDNKRIKTNSKEFKIEKTPFNYHLKEEEKELIKDIFKTYSNNKIVLSGLFENLSNLLNFNMEDIISDNFEKPDNNELYIKSKKIIIKAKNERKKISFLYKGIGKEEKNISGFPYSIDKDEKKIERFMIYIPELPEDFRYLEFNINRIQEIPKITNDILIGDFMSIFAKFKLYPPTSNTYNLMPGEIEESKNDDGTVIIRTRYYTVFRLIQKLFKYGETAEILYPDHARNQMKEKIIKMQKLYE